MFVPAYSDKATTPGMLNHGSMDPSKITPQVERKNEGMNAEKSHLSAYACMPTILAVLSQAN